jgi:hypothetical protein
MVGGWVFKAGAKLTARGAKGAKKTVLIKIFLFMINYNPKKRGWNCHKEAQGAQKNTCWFDQKIHSPGR